MPRTVSEWVGKSDDTPIPPRVQLRVYIGFDGRCAECGRKIGNGVAWQTDHIIALVNGGRHCESNLQTLCQVPCHQDKTRQDVKEKSRVYKSVLKRSGIKKSKWRPLIGSRASGWKRRMDGSLVRR